MCANVPNENLAASISLSAPTGNNLLRIAIYDESTGTPLLDEILSSSNSIDFDFIAFNTYGILVDFRSNGSFNLTVSGLPGNNSGTANITIVGAAPVTWTTPLAAQSFGESLKLSFSVADQVDVAGYELERAVGTQPFAKVADIEYVENGSLEVDYSISTPWVREGSYYRIKQLDFAGTYDYSNVIFVEGNDGARQRFQMFPNPATDFVRMSLPAEVTSVDLISASGQLLRSAPASEVNRDGLDVRGVSPGLYLVRPVGGDQPSPPQRLVVSH